MSKLYLAFRAMHNRCYDQNVKSYKDYGARGIYVVDRWHGRRGFQNFQQDMGDRPEGYSLERIDNNGPYGPENCRWASRAEQSRNKRNNVFLTFQGQTKCLAEWAQELKCSHGAISYRLKSGMTVEEALSKPIERNSNAKLSEKDVSFIQDNYPLMSAQKIATCLKVSKKTVLNVLHGKTFKSIQERLANGYQV